MSAYINRYCAKKNGSRENKKVYLEAQNSQFTKETELGLAPFLLVEKY